MLCSLLAKINAAFPYNKQKIMILLKSSLRTSIFMQQGYCTFCGCMVILFFPIRYTFPAYPNINAHVLLLFTSVRLLGSNFIQPHRPHLIGWHGCSALYPLESSSKLASEFRGKCQTIANMATLEKLKPCTFSERDKKQPLHCSAN